MTDFYLNVYYPLVVYAVCFFFGLIFNDVYSILRKTQSKAICLVIITSVIYALGIFLYAIGMLIGVEQMWELIILGTVSGIVSGITYDQLWYFPKAGK